MALDDRERNFEKAMARELRADALNGLHCPDAETLAAYHDRLLSPEEMAAQKSHIVSCERCQEVLATLEMTEAVASEKQQDVVAVAAQKALPAVPVAPVFSRPGQAVPTDRSNLREMPKSKPYLRWAVPAGAIAAGLLVWVAINSSWSQRKAAMRSASAPVEIAENREQKEPQLAAPKSEVVAPAARTGGALKSDADLKQQAAPQEADKELLDDVQKSSRAKLGAATNLPHGPRVLQNQAQNQIQNNANANDAFTYRQSQTGEGSGASGAAAGGSLGGVAGALSKPAPTPAAPPKAALKRMDEARKEAPAAPPPPPAAAYSENDRKDTTQSVEVTAAAPMVEEETATKEKKSLDAGGVTQQLGGFVRNQNEALQIRGRDFQDLGLAMVSTPDPEVFWLVQADGSLRKTENGGLSNVLQTPGKGIKAIAGAATDAKTCWVLAQGNLVFRTTNGGKGWKQVSTPIGAEFKTIVATDKQRATVSDAAGAVKLATTDGGATWTAVQP